MFKVAHGFYKICSILECKFQGNYSKAIYKEKIFDCFNFSSLLRRSYCNLNENVTIDIDYDAITGGDKTAEHKLKVIILEMEVLRQEGLLVPDTDAVKKENWIHILELSSRSGRRKYFEYLFKLSKTRENQKLKKHERRVQREESILQNDKKKLSFEEFVSSYDLTNNNIFLRIYESTMNQMYNNKLMQAIQFGQKLVVDCGYEPQMTPRENANCAKQLMLLFSENRIHDDPFDLHYCNCNFEGSMIQNLHRRIPTMYERSFPLNVYQTSYLDIFPKEKLVYLTPHCREEMKEYDHDAIYIVGAIVDKTNQEPLSLAKAKEEGLKMAKLPLDKYLQWGSGSGKSLTLNQVVSILLDVKRTGDWDFALRHVPKRKLIDFQQVYIDKQRKSITESAPKNKRLWTPSANTNLDRLSYKNKTSTMDRPRKNKVNIRSIFND